MIDIPKGNIKREFFDKHLPTLITTGPNLSFGVISITVNYDGCLWTMTCYFVMFFPSRFCLSFRLLRLCLED